MPVERHRQLLVTVDGQVNKDAARYYRQPSPAAQIAGHVAFWHGVQVRRVSHAEWVAVPRTAAGSAGGYGPMFGR
jgi:hypothetical protein